MDIRKEQSTSTDKVSKITENPLDGFSKLSREERYQRLLDLGYIGPVEFDFLMNEMPMDPSLSDHFIENSIGNYKMPIGVAVHFNINGEDKIIPMAVEETSIIAAASKTAKWVKSNGEITARALGQDIIGQIQIARSQNPTKAVERVLAQKQKLISDANVIAEGMVKRGGGVKDITARIIPRSLEIAGDNDSMVVFHVMMDPCDAMGANVINQVCEALKPKIEELTQDVVTMCILSNLVDTKLTEAKVVIRNIDPEIGKGIEEASLFAQLDPYRAATNNKGVMNGIDAVLIATGNDWRAVEAGVHSYAAQSGRYKSITQWKMIGKDLVGTLTAPIVVGTVGGVTQLHPTAKMALKILKIQDAQELSNVAASVGLVQNLGALKALSGIGIVQGHMRLHAGNLALQAGANQKELPQVQVILQKLLDSQKKITVQDAKDILEKLRKGLLYS
ncbi:MAG: hydroxymethylglutaryl-CoA reductase, degradative [Bdellovibrionota bacterium]